MFSHCLNVKAVTYDGTKTNLKAIQMFGCKIYNVDSPHEFDGSFIYNGRKILFSPDVPHNLKLTRNFLADLGVFIDNKSERIE